MANLLQRIQARAAGGTGKSLVDVHPEVTEREHVFSIRSDAALWSPYSYLNAIVDYESHMWIRKAVNTIADNLAPLPLYITRGKDRIDDHPLLTLLTTVNQQMTSLDLWRQWCIDLLLGGEEGWELVKSKGGKYVELWPRQPHQFNVLPDKQRARYFEVAAYEIDDHLGDPFKLPPEEFVHFKFYNPRNPWRGIAVMLALRMSIVIDVFAQAWEKYLFQNNARPDYAVIAPQGTTQGERDAIEKKLQQKYGGPQNAGKVIALEEGITDVKILSYRPKDLGSLELRKMSRDEIAGLFGVPDILMGFGNDSYDTAEKRTAAIQALYTLTIKPLAGFRDGMLTEKFQRVGVLSQDEMLHTDYGGVAELREEDNDEWTRASDQIGRGALLVNEWRTAHGLEPVPWGDVWYAPLNVAPVGSSTPPEGSGTHGLANSEKTVRVDPRHNGHSRDVLEISDLLVEAIDAARTLDDAHDQ